MGEVLASKPLREQLEQTAKAELQSWMQRYTMLTKLVAAVAEAAGLRAA